MSPAPLPPHSKSRMVVVSAGESKPKRPLSAYNFFFQEKRQELLKDLPVRPEGKPSRRGHGKMGFALMAKTVAAEWKTIDAHTKQKFEVLAKQESIRYKRELAEWKKQTKARKKNEKNKTKLQAAATTARINNDNNAPAISPVPSAVFVPSSAAAAEMATRRVSFEAQEMELPFHDNLFDEEQMPNKTGSTAPPVAAPVLSSSMGQANPALFVGGCQPEHQQLGIPPSSTDYSLGQLLLQGARMQRPVQQPHFQALPPAMQQLQNESNLRDLAFKMEDDCVDLFLNMFQ